MKKHRTWLARFDAVAELVDDDKTKVHEYMNWFFKNRYKATDIPFEIRCLPEMERDFAFMMDAVSRRALSDCGNKPSVYRELRQHYFDYVLARAKG